MRNGVIVVGSLNMDLVMRVPRLPQAGETMKSEAFDVIPGGKGANQAVAAARLGAPVTMVGSVGEDEYGTRLLAQLQTDEVDVAHVDRLVDSPTGIAQIVVDGAGNNQIVISAGANGQITRSQLQKAFADVDGAAVCLLQLETPMGMVAAAAEMAAEAGMKVILDPAPAAALPSGLLDHVHVITPNETETWTLTGVEVTDIAAAEEAARMLVDRGADAAVIKMGGRGAFLFDGEQTYFRHAIPVSVVDTTAAGDAFNGALGVALSRGSALSEAVDYATAVGALAVTRSGAQPSLPSAAQLRMFLEQRETQ